MFYKGFSSSVERLWKKGFIKKLNHVIYRCTYHIVWTSKYRYRVFEGLVKEQLSNELSIDWEHISSNIDNLITNQ